MCQVLEYIIEQRVLVCFFVDFFQLSILLSLLPPDQTTPPHLGAGNVPRRLPLQETNFPDYLLADHDKGT